MMKTRFKELCAACILACLLAVPTVRGNSISFIDIGVLPPSSVTTAIALSDDGSTIIGTSGIPFIWTQESGLQPFNDFGTGFLAQAVSGNGEVLAGTVRDFSIFPPIGAFVPARVSVAPFSFDQLPFPSPPSGATGVRTFHGLDASWNGGVVVGYFQYNGIPDESDYYVYRWDSGGVQPIGHGFSPSSRQIVVSNDGAVVAGLLDHQLFRWTEGGSTQYYDIFPFSGSVIGDISGDGSTVVGGASLQNGGSAVAFRWTETGGYEVVNSLVGGVSTRARAVSEDGSIIAGSSADGPFLWDAFNGVRLISDLLLDGGVDVAGWNLGGAANDVFMSDDGKTLVGNGINPDGQQATWMARFPSAAIVWTGEQAIGGSWGDPGNWNPETVPGANDNVVFRGVNYNYLVPIEVDRSVLCIELTGTGTVEMFSNPDVLTAGELRMGTSLLDNVTLQLTNLTLEVDQANLGAAEGAVAKLEVLAGGSFHGVTVRVGAEERAELIVDSGGTANITSLLIARNDGNDSQVTVRNGGQLSINTELRIGENRPGKLVIQTGGILSSGSMPDIQINQGSSAEVTGSTTSWMTPLSELGVAGGTLTVQEQATVEVLNVNMLANSSEEASISVKTHGELKVNNTLTISSLGTGTAGVSVSEEAKLTVKDIALASLSPGSEDHATLFIFDDATAEISGEVTIDSLNGAEGHSLVNVSLGGQVVQTGSLTRVNDNGTLQIDAESSWTNTFGDLEVDGGRVVVRFNGEATFDKIRLFGGAPTTFVDVGSVNIEDATVTADDVIVVGNDNTSGRFSLTNGVLNAGTEIQNTANGQIFGTGSVNTPRVVGPGVISPGLSPGTLTINGDLELEAGGVLEMEFAGLTPDAEHDVLEVTGDTTIDGEVLLKFISGFAPSQGDEFEFLLTGGTADLSAAQFEIVNLAPGFQFDIMPSAGGITMTALNDGVYDPVITLAGDYNEDGVVNAADYVVWRNNKGEGVTIPNDATHGAVTQEDYDVWVANFGATVASGDDVGSSVPEPSTALLAGLLACAGLIAGQRARRAGRESFRD